MKLPVRFLHWILLGTLPVTLHLLAGPDDKPKGSGNGKGGPVGGGGAPVEPAVVPQYSANILLGRPGADSVSASVLSWKDMEGVIQYGEHINALDRRTPPHHFTAGEPQLVVLDHLKPDTAYWYQFSHRSPGGPVEKDEVHTFHTQRAPSSTFSFAIQADSHLDVNTDMRVYQQTLANMVQEKPDFLIDLGDTTMVDKFGSFFTRAESQYKAQRYYFGQIGHSIPLFLTLGNHDGEQGSRLTGQPNSMPLWSVAMRKKYFPNPEPGGIYSGNNTPFEPAGLLEDYYAWQWGSALFMVLDPFWYTRERNRGSGDNWNMTLGDAQYRWLTRTLESSSAPFKFVFIHHLVGGLGRDVRGGIAPAPYMEWGGKNADGSDGFAQHRPGWSSSLHQLFVKHGVSIVFHGHDHLYAKEELDGIVYQEVPQPSHPGGGTRSAEEYGYKGLVLGSSGFLKVSVSPAEATVTYLQTSVPGVTRNNGPNNAVAHQYTLQRP